MLEIFSSHPRGRRPRTRREQKSTLPLTPRVHSWGHRYHRQRLCSLSWAFALWPLRTAPARLTPGDAHIARSLDSPVERRQQPSSATKSALAPFKNSYILNTQLERSSSPGIVLRKPLRALNGSRRRDMGILHIPASSPRKLPIKGQ
jgi:hypothetical protein